MPIKIESNKKLKLFTSSQKVILGIILVGSVYLLGLAGLKTYARINTVPIKNKSHLEEILKEETKSLGLENKEINVKYIKDMDKWKPGNIIFAYAQKIGENKYEVVLGPDGYNSSTLKHELYHIADGHLEGNLGNVETYWDQLVYLFWNEPQATIYQTTGLKP